MVKFTCVFSGVSWELRRNDRLICFFSTREGIVSAATGFAETAAKQGKAASVIVEDGGIADERTFGAAIHQDGAGKMTRSGVE